MVEIGIQLNDVIQQRGDFLAQLSFDDQEHLYRELDASPRMATHIAELLSYPDPIEAINLSALQAALNEFDSHEYRESAGLWPVLRREVRLLPYALTRAVREATKGLTLAQQVAIVEGMEQGTVEFGIAGIEGTGLGFWGAVLGSAIQVGGSLIQTDLMGDIQKDIAEEQAKLQLRLGQQRLAAETELAEKRLAIEAALKAREIEVIAETEVKKAEVSAVGATIGGVPVWLIPVVLLGGGLLVWLFLKFKQ